MATTAIIPSNSDAADYDRLTELKEFDDSKLGVKGLIDSGLKSIPRIFIHPKETLSDINTKSKPNNDVISDIPTIDMSGSGDHRRSEIVEQIGRACRELGFFQVVNHGVPQEVMDGAIRGIKGLHEQAMEVKAELYNRDLRKGGVSFFCNLDLFRSKAASWRDTIQMQLGGPEEVKAEQIPEICRKEMVEWNLHSKQVAELIMELMCEGLGLNPTKLKDLTCSAGRTLFGHYYPYCPQPDLTVGSTSHTDPGVLTVLLQDQIGGLQVKHGDGWVDVEPVLGALIINVGDILQIMSNDEYKSVEHRVEANSGEEPRISMATFFNPCDMEGIYGPIPELISAENPPHYREFVLTDFFRRFFDKELEGKTLSNSYKLEHKVGFKIRGCGEGQNKHNTTN